MKHELEIFRVHGWESCFATCLPFVSVSSKLEKTTERNQERVPMMLSHGTLF
jgi:hypothetical protein